MREEHLKISVPAGYVTAVQTKPKNPPRCALIYAPGSNSNINDPFGNYASCQLAAESIALTRFQFPYMEAGRRSPDRGPILKETWRAVIDSVRPIGFPLVVGGRSMGGRIVSEVVAEGIPVDALILLAYPLHPPGRATETRDEHLPSISIPTLFCSGTRDAFASITEIKTMASSLPQPSVHMLEAANHGFAAPKSSGRTRQDIWDETISAIARFVNQVLEGR